MGRWQRTKDVLDSNRSGRKKKLTTELLETVKKIIQKQGGKSPKLAAIELHRQLGVKISPQTVRRRLWLGGWEGKPALKVPKLSQDQMNARVEFSKENARTPFTQWLFTDSSIFHLKPSKASRTLKYWGPVGERHFQEVTRDSRKVHVYAGVSFYGVTPLLYVEGTTGFRGEFIDPKTGQPQRGVSAKSYHGVFKDFFLPEGNKLFRGTRWEGSWIYQQDGASVHTAKSTKDLQAHLMPDRVVMNWPANSPDLSWIENMWAILDQRLRQRGDFKDMAEFKAALEEVWSGIDISICRKSVHGMRDRLKQCIKRGGANIRK